MAAVAKSKATAPGPYLGYGLQPVRLCYYLLSGGQYGEASLEHLDDVALKHPDDTLLLEQTKSALKQNPVSDWSDELWKTFANWIDCIDSGVINPSSTMFQLYVTPTRTGYWVDRLSKTTIESAVPPLMADLENAVERRRPSQKCYRYVKKFLNADRTTVTALVVNFRMASDEDPINPIRNNLRIAVHEEILDVSCIYAIGLAKQMADNCIRNGRPAIVSKERFQKEVRAFLGKHNLAKMLPSFASNPTREEIETTLDEQPTFVRQLHLVDMKHSVVLRAISALLQSSADKTNWAERGLVVSESLVEFDSSLLQRYTMQKIEVEEVHGSLELSAQGRLLYSRCVSKDANLEGREVPNHFVTGCYNGLADRLELGWHPNFRTMLDGNPS